MKFIIVSYYTKGSYYKREALNLYASCELFNINSCIEEVKDQGSWQRNTLFKAQFIKVMLKRHENIAVVFIDADAKVRQDPELFNRINADVGVCYRDYSKFPSMARKKGRELLSGTVYFKNNFNSWTVVNQWIMENKRNEGTWEQKNLQKVIERNRGRVNIVEMPPQYCQIFDSMRTAGKPVIEHYQASRKYRRRYNKHPGQTKILTTRNLSYLRRQ